MNEPRVLVLEKDRDWLSFDSLWAGLNGKVKLTRVKVGKSELTGFPHFLRAVRPGDYDRVIAVLNMRRMQEHLAALATIPNLVWYEEDACQEYVQRSEVRGMMLPWFLRLRPDLVLSPNLTFSKDLENAGQSATYFPKWVDTTRIRPINTKREIACGFVGATSNKVYRARRHTLEYARRKAGLQLLRTERGNSDEYNALLARIQVFVSADIGFQEYMFKNFEAAAAGCALVAYRQGNGVEKSLGFRDMENIVLYENRRELVEKLNQLREHPTQREAFAQAGQRLVLERHTQEERAAHLAEILTTGA